MTTTTTLNDEPRPARLLLIATTDDVTAIAFVWTADDNTAERFQILTDLEQPFTDAIYDGLVANLTEWTTAKSGPQDPLPIGWRLLSVINASPVHAAPSSSH